MRKIISIVLAILMSLGFISPIFITNPVFADSLDDMKREDAKLSARIKKNQKERERIERYLKVLRGKETDSLKKLDTTKQQIDEVENDLENTERVIIKTKQDIEVARVMMSKIGNKVDVKRDEVGRLLTFYYKSSGHRFVDVVFSSQSLSELLTRAKLTKFLIDGTGEAINSLHSSVTEIALLKQRKQQNEIELNDLFARQSENKQMLLNLSNQYDRIYKQIINETILTKNQQRILQEQSARDALRKEQLAIAIAKEVEKRRALQGKNILQSSGLWAWPLQGRINSRFGEFGMRIHPISRVFTMHEGIDIDGGMGAPIKAAGPGIVGRASISSSDGFGNCVFIYHGYNSQGKQIMTIYAHMSRYNCKVDQEVKKGDIIGFVGSTGRSTGPHLHLEFRENGKPVNPRNYLSKL